MKEEWSGLALLTHLLELTRQRLDRANRLAEQERALAHSARQDAEAVTGPRSLMYERSAAYHEQAVIIHEQAAALQALHQAHLLALGTSG